MCVQYRGGCSVPWGISWVPWGNTLSTMGCVQYRGGISWVPWGVQYRGGYHEYHGGYLEYRGGCSVPWGDIMMHVGGYHEYRGGCSVPWGVKSFVIWVPHGTEHPPRYSWYPPTCIMISPPRYSNFKGWYPPTVLNTPHGTHDIPPRASWYPHGTEHPHSTQDNPHGTHDIPHGTEHPHGTQDIPHGTEHPHGTQDIPHGTEHPLSTEHPHGTEHPPQYCTHIIQGVDVKFGWVRIKLCFSQGLLDKIRTTIQSQISFENKVKSGTIFPKQAQSYFNSKYARIEFKAIYCVWNEWSLNLRQLLKTPD